MKPTSHNLTCDGLTSLVLNNNYSDATMMKEALTYDMFQYLGADSSLYNYAKVSVNGEYYGIYLALEPVDESFAMRNYGSDYGNLYKPDSMNMGGVGKMNDFSPSEVKNALPDFNGKGIDGKTPPGFSNNSSDGNNAAPPDLDKQRNAERNDFSSCGKYPGAAGRYDSIYMGRTI